MSMMEERSARRRRSFTAEFKAEAVALAVDGDRPIADVARSLGSARGLWASGSARPASIGANARGSATATSAIGPEPTSTVAHIRQSALKVSCAIGTSPSGVTGPGGVPAPPGTTGELFKQSGRLSIDTTRLAQSHRTRVVLLSPRFCPHDAVAYLADVQPSGRDRRHPTEMALEGASASAGQTSSVIEMGGRRTGGRAVGGPTSS